MAGQETAHEFDVSQAQFQSAVIDASFERPVLVDYWAAWCGPCRALGPILSKVVADLDGAVRLAKVDTEAEQALAAEHGIRSLPTVRLFRDGVAIAEFMGAQPESAIRDFIATHAQLPPSGALAEAQALIDSGDLDAAEVKLRSHLAEHGDDVAGHAMLIEIALTRGDASAAQAHVDELPMRLRVQERIAALTARITFAGADALDDGAQDDTERRYRGALRAISSNDVESGLDDLLEIMRSDRSFRDDGARKALLDAFVMLGPDDPRVAEYRGRMFSLLH